MCRISTKFPAQGTMANRDDDQQQLKDTIDKVIASVDDLEKQEMVRRSLIALTDILDRKFEAVTALSKQVYAADSSRSLLEKSRGCSRRSQKTSQNEYSDEGDDRSFRSFDSDKLRKGLNRVTRRRTRASQSKTEDATERQQLLSSRPIKTLFITKTGSRLGSLWTRRALVVHHFLLILQLNAEALKDGHNTVLYSDNLV